MQEKKSEMLGEEPVRVLCGTPHLLCDQSNAKEGHSV